MTKRILSLLLCAVTLLGGATFGATSAAAALLGDVTLDGRVDSADASLILRYDLGLSDIGSAALKNGDVNSDGYVDSADASLILQYDLGLIDEFPKAATALNVPRIDRPTLTISAAESRSVNGNMSVTGQVDTYYVTTENGGNVRFDFTMMSGVVFEVYIKDSLNTTVKYSSYMTNGNGITAPLQPNQTYTVYVYQDTGHAQYTMKIWYPKAVKDISAYDTVKDSVQYTDQVNNYIFTPEYNGVYRFDFTMMSGVVLEVYFRDELNSVVKYSSYMTNGNGIDVQLESGKQYVVSVYQDDDFADYTMTIGHQQQRLDASGYSKVNDRTFYTNQINCYDFVPTVSGVYRFDFTLMSGVVLEFYVRDYLNSTVKYSSYMTNGYGINVTLTAGERYTLYVYQDEDLADYTMSIGYPKAISNVAVGSTINGSLTYTGQEDRYRITASSSGKISLSVSGLNGAVIELYVYDELNTKITYDSYCINGDTLTFNATAGKVYTVYVCQDSGLTPYNISIKKA